LNFGFCHLDFCIMKKFILLILIALFPTAIFAYTSPGSPTGHINDFANVLSADAKTSLEQTLSNYETQSGNQLAVAIIPELEDETIETFAEKLYQEWGIGKKGKDNGALFLVSVKDRKMRIEVGYGLEGDLTDIESKKILDNVVPPYFKASDYNSGVQAAVSAMIEAIGGELNVAPAKKSSASQFPYGNYFWIAIGLFMWLTSILARSRSWWLGGVIGGVVGAVIWIVWSIIFTLPVLVVFGLLFDFIVSKKYKQAASTGNFHGLWWMGGGKGPWDKGGGWGGFGGGRSGGGGASGGW